MRWVASDEGHGSDLKRLFWAYVGLSSATGIALASTNRSPLNQPHLDHLYRRALQAAGVCLKTHGCGYGQDGDRTGGKQPVLSDARLGDL